MAGCSGGHDPTADIAPMWRDQIEQVLRNNPSDFEKRVLADFSISDAEYQEARALYGRCMANLGWTVVDQPDGSYLISGTAGTANEGKAVPNETRDTCAAGTINWIEPLYLGMKDNPEGLTPVQLIRRCFEQHGVPDGEGMSDDAFNGMLNDANYQPSSPQASACLLDPQGKMSDEAIPASAQPTTAPS